MGGLRAWAACADVNNQEALYTQATMPSDILPLTEAQLQNLTETVPEVFTGRQVTDNYNIVTMNRVRLSRTRRWRRSALLGSLRVCV